MLRTVSALALLLLALLAGGTPLQAKPKEDPNTIVSNTGAVPPASADKDKGKQESVSLPFEGTGALVNGGAGTVNEEPVAAVAAPGQEAGIESVIGADGRYRITTTTSFPYRAIVHITSSIGGCSGWLISANTVATAGHCVYGSGGWATNVVVYPGRNGTSTPYGSCTARQLYAVSGWTSSQNRNYDYAAIKLNCSIGNTTGFFGYRVSTTSLNGQPSYTAGYPGDKTYATMWRSDDTIRITQTYRLYYANDTYGGQSGSIVWNSEAGCSTCGIAIHAYGVDSTGYNGGTRITQEVYNNLTTWKNAP
jgi:glutamyl endopeptidase